ncbi:PD-(D/E)XK nuclease family protein [Lacrimispora defluvii]|uniref:PD-(D/E)XK nuclease family protein n=1 Tax=Lacrimispora defluvii TaxID=2719233 RepID=A0ABX1VV92_9FIRM|nr:PD-(D/E)XK nuclease family protein [Lacrimispora defluvii]NNJ32261.1 PD-(D/E)XK nuclease family protein [Lacrimispora defluvii]
MDLRNNLFTYATSELSQDAFLCWMLSFAMPESKGDHALRSCAEQLLRIAIPELVGTSVCVDEISRQTDSIDVLITVNGRYKLIIEDKTYTSEHSNQLSRYLQHIEEKFPQFTVCGVYYKTGFQSDYTTVRDAGYTIIDRKKMISIMKPFSAQITNHIWQDYYEFLATFEAEAEQFRTLPIHKWEWRQINAFYDNLKQTGFLEELGVSGNYGYVSNPTGGFDGMWFGQWERFSILDVSCELYLQLQFVEGQLHICLKLSADKDALTEKRLTGRMLRDRVVYGKAGEYLFEKHGFLRPARFGNGRTMTLGEYRSTPAFANDACTAIHDATAAYFRILQETKFGGNTQCCLR